MVYIAILVGGGFNHLEKYEFVNGKDDIMENMKCSKPTTSDPYILVGGFKYWDMVKIWLQNMVT